MTGISPPVAFSGTTTRAKGELIPIVSVVMLSRAKLSGPCNAGLKHDGFSSSSAISASQFALQLSPFRVDATLRLQSDRNVDTKWLRL